MRGFICAVFLLAAFPVCGRAFPQVSVKAPYAFLMDAETGTVLFEKNADTLTAPASMTKVVTLSLLFSQLKQGFVSLDDKFYVSVNAWKKGGAASGSSTMFLEPESFVDVESLIRGVVIHSGNDAAIAIAEGLSGTEEAFAEAMTAHARSLGLERSRFLNATGWPEAGHETTAREMALMALKQIEDHPDLYRYYSESRFNWNGIAQKNRNDLLGLGIGVDGLKTGRASASGFGIVASAEERGRRLVLVLNGLESEGERRQESRRLLTWGFRAFRSYVLFRAGDVVETVPVWHGRQGRLPVTLAEDLSVALTSEARRGMKVEMLYQAPVAAPVQRGMEVGRLRVTDDAGRILAERDLIAGESIGRLGVFGRALNTIEFLLFGG